MKTHLNRFKTLAGISLLIILAACGSSVDKKSELEKLKKEHDQIAEQIKKLEAELKLSDTASVKLIDVNVTEVAKSEFNHYIEVQGKVDGSENTTVFPANMGTVMAVYVKEGDAVKKGQVLAQIDNSVLTKNIETSRVNADLANTIFQKYKALWDQKIGTEVQFLQAKTNKEAADKNLAALMEQLDLYKIKSPINGTIEEVNLKVGQYASPQSPLPAFRVVNFSSVKIQADIAEVYAPKVKSGDKVIIYFPDFDKELKAQINFSSRYINPTNRTFQVEMRLGPSQVDYRANMIAVVRINDYTNKDAVVLPVNVLKESQSGKFVFVAVNNGGKTIAHKIAVTVGQTYNGLAEIISGLNPGDKVISTGQNNLIEGQLVQVK